MPDKYGVGQDHYCYPGSDVLVNLLGITDGEELSAAEVEFTMLRLREYRYTSFSEFSLSSLKNIHFYLFQDLYAWAGETRAVDISKGSTRFAATHRIEPEATKLFDQMRRERFLTSLENSDFVARMSHYFCELNVLHPFREGNGRAQRLLFEILAVNAGYEIRWQEVPAALWIPANIAAYNGKLSPLIALFEKATSRLR